MNKSETIAKLAVALVKAQQMITFAAKDASNPFFKSKYADLPEVIDSCKKPLNENGIVFLQVIVPEGVETVLLHESGEFISGVTPIVCTKANDPQALGSAITYAKRYGLQAIVGIPADVDDDGEAAMSRATKTPTTKRKSNEPPSREAAEEFMGAYERGDDFSDLGM